MGRNQRRLKKILDYYLIILDFLGLWFIYTGLIYLPTYPVREITGKHGILAFRVILFYHVCLPPDSFVETPFYTNAFGRNGVNYLINLGGAVDNFPATVAADYAVRAYCNGTATFEETREKLLLFSSCYYASRMGRLQMHHGEIDYTVPYIHAMKMDSTMRDLGRDTLHYEFISYETGEHTTWTMPGFWDEAYRFMMTVVKPVVYVAGDHITTTGTGDAYQWYYEGELMPDATDSILFIPWSGNYRVEFATRNGKTFSSEEYFAEGRYYDDPPAPSNYSIVALFPNPFNPSLTLRIIIRARVTINLALYNTLGQEVHTYSGFGNVSRHYFQREFTINGEGLSTGIYFLHVNIPGHLDEVRKVVLIR